MTLQEFSALVADTFGPANTVITPAEVATVLLAIPSVIETEVTKALATAAATAGSEQKSVPGGVDTVAKTNIPLNSGSQIINGYQVPIGGTVLLANQTNPAENGIYTLGNTGFTRTEGYQTPAELSRLNVSVVYGNDAGNVYQQPNTLPNGSAEKEFALTNSFSENLKALVSSAKDITKYPFVDITTTGEGDDLQVTQTYNIADKLNGGDLRAVYVQQSDFGGPMLEKGIDYDFNSGTSVLTIFKPLPERGKIRLEVVVPSAYGLGYGLKLEYIPDNPNTNVGFKFLGPGNADVIPIEDFKAIVYSGNDTQVLSVTNISKGYLVPHDKGTDELSIEAFGLDGKPDRAVYAYDKTMTSYKVYVPTKFTGKIYARFYPKTV